MLSELEQQLEASLQALALNSSPVTFWQCAVCDAVISNDGRRILDGKACAPHRHVWRAVGG